MFSGRLSPFPRQIQVHQYVVWGDDAACIDALPLCGRVILSLSTTTSSNDSEDSSESSSTYGDSDIVSVVAEFISELQEQQPADAPSAQDSIAASGEEAVVPLAPP